MLLSDEQAGVLDKALSRLRELGLDVRIDMAAGGIYAIVIQQPEGEVAYEPRVVLTAGPSTAHLRPQSQLPPLMIAPFVTSHTADIWRRQMIAFADTAGNMHLRGPGLLIDVRGRPRPAAMASPKTLRAFKNHGLRVIFALLCDPKLAASPYREIAHLSGTSLGTVHAVFTELHAMSYIAGGDDARRLRRSHDLFRRWADAYAIDLFPRLKVASFDAPDPSWWKHATDAVRANGGQWGAEVAAHLLGSRLLPARAAIYASNVPSELAIQQRFRRASGEGNVEIRERFWSFQPPQNSPVVPTPLIYADLLASGDPRAIEAAEYLKENDEVLRRLAEG